MSSRSSKEQTGFTTADRAPKGASIVGRWSSGRWHPPVKRDRKARRFESYPAHQCGRISMVDDGVANAETRVRFPAAAPDFLRSQFDWTNMGFRNLRLPVRARPSAPTGRRKAVIRLLWEQETLGSNPSVPTISRSLSRVETDAGRGQGISRNRKVKRTAVVRPAPIGLVAQWQSSALSTLRRGFDSLPDRHGRVAQLDRVAAFYSACWGFESLRDHQFQRLFR